MCLTLKYFLGLQNDLMNYENLMEKYILRNHILIVQINISVLN